MVRLTWVGRLHTSQVNLEITLGWDSPFQLSVEGGKGTVHISGACQKKTWSDGDGLLGCLVCA